MYHITTIVRPDTQCRFCIHPSEYSFHSTSVYLCGSIVRKLHALVEAFKYSQRLPSKQGVRYSVYGTQAKAITKKENPKKKKMKETKG